MPKIEVYIEKNSKLIEKFINSELLFYIINLNFLNWDFYVANYLTSLKEFRNYLNRLFSKAEKFHIKYRSLASIESKISKLRIKNSLDHTLTKENEETENAQIYKSSIIDDNVDQNKEIKKQIGFFNTELFSNDTMIHDYSEKDSQMSFLVTTNNKGNYDEEEYGEQAKLNEYVGYMYKIESFSINITNLQGVTTTIKLNIKQMKILSYLSKFVKIERLLKKIILCDSQKGYYLDLAFFDKIDIKNFILFEHIFYSSKVTKNNSEIQLENCSEETRVKIDIK